MSSWLPLSTSDTRPGLGYSASSAYRLRTASRRPPAELDGFPPVPEDGAPVRRPVQEVRRIAARRAYAQLTHAASPSSASSSATEHRRTPSICLTSTAAAAILQGRLTPLLPCDGPARRKDDFAIERQAARRNRQKAQRRRAAVGAGREEQEIDVGASVQIRPASQHFHGQRTVDPQRRAPPLRDASPCAARPAPIAEISRHPQRPGEAAGWRAGCAPAGSERDTGARRRPRCRAAA